MKGLPLGEGGRPEDGRMRGRWPAGFRRTVPHQARCARQLPPGEALGLCAPAVSSYRGSLHCLKKTGEPIWLPGHSSWANRAL